MVKSNNSIQMGLSDKKSSKLKKQLKDIDVKTDPKKYFKIKAQISMEESKFNNYVRDLEDQNKN